MNDYNLVTKQLQNRLNRKKKCIGQLTKAHYQAIKIDRVNCWDLLNKFKGGVVKVNNR